MAKINPDDSLPAAFAKQLLQLATAGFGLVAALAWNDAIKNAIEEYIKPRVANGTGIISQLIYALIITALAVLITYQLTKITRRFERKKKNNKN
ncbi:MAG: hypothetical protein A3D24_04185 [Candidatus Blackburnbacteria bacterium RIFCSPHIGHO2_02_FULL_39_13]|uniref:Uncharacterized protein n=1 Tax=Candidatus Blackburnbacteria bacterium RIFCSPLOWO2_01_FULL_40_20 TaxID=1797519 RepID=A0A1G1VB20_9BACT|nr:MAG: hypothetical protein UT38_C0002G0019 [Microgenomates group bacterium GW2011_GWA2_39_19]OGY07376.1 MAG: hypothetical protein A2694_01960 [Candidatus Blackburnbacteria bacterium RIFCSPHIGHO2_01_FULL_40_17]OGY09856.1 MAG: hypothetical protein A3D24_04185 [Candidatus Blackburnbacteria bacterium RIFCSPHIGHO2_02_FULL_39_13]OGY12471.1 MAG: hypothetical protein A3A77_00645 [Candidatus Blackburnbacteria bacterium RIFCSPLOWO2_01_FULL_40_20]